MLRDTVADSGGYLDYGKSTLKLGVSITVR